jgi:hypothetical protein
MRRLVLNIPVACHKNPEMGREDPGARTSTPVQNLVVWATGNAFLMKAADAAARAGRRSTDVDQQSLPMPGRGRSDG